MSSYGCDVGYALLYLNVIGLGSGVWVSSLLKRIGSPLMWGGVHAASTSGNKMIECYCFLIIIMVDVPEGCRSVSPTPNTYFFHFRASRARRTMTAPPTSFVVVILF